MGIGCRARAEESRCQEEPCVYCGGAPQEHATPTDRPGSLLAGPRACRQPWQCGAGPCTLVHAPYHVCVPCRQRMVYGMARTVDGQELVRSVSNQAKQVKQARVSIITDHHHDCGVPLHASAGERGRSSAAHQKGRVGHDAPLPTEPFLVAPTRPVPPRVRGHAGDAGNSAVAGRACPGPQICADGEGAASTRCIRPCTSGQCWHMSHGPPGPRKPAPGPRQRPTQPCTVRPEACGERAGMPAQWCAWASRWWTVVPRLGARNSNLPSLPSRRPTSAHGGPWNRALVRVPSQRL